MVYYRTRNKNIKINMIEGSMQGNYLVFIKAITYI